MQVEPTPAATASATAVAAEIPAAAEKEKKRKRKSEAGAVEGAEGAEAIAGEDGEKKVRYRSLSRLPSSRLADSFASFSLSLSQKKKKKKDAVEGEVVAAAEGVEVRCLSNKSPARASPFANSSPRLVRADPQKGEEEEGEEGQEGGVASRICSFPCFRSLCFCVYSHLRPSSPIALSPSFAFASPITFFRASLFVVLSHLHVFIIILSSKRKVEERKAVGRKSRREVRARGEVVNL